MTGAQVVLAVVAGLPGVLVGMFLVVRGPRVIGALLVLLGLLPFMILSPDSGVGGTQSPHGVALVRACSAWDSSILSSDIAGEAEHARLAAM